LGGMAMVMGMAMVTDIFMIIKGKRTEEIDVLGRNCLMI